MSHLSPQKLQLTVSIWAMLTLSPPSWNQRTFFAISFHTVSDLYLISNTLDTLLLSFALVYLFVYCLHQPDWSRIFLMDNLPQIWTNSMSTLDICTGCSCPTARTKLYMLNFVTPSMLFQIIEQKNFNHLQIIRLLHQPKTNQIYKPYCKFYLCKKEQIFGRKKFIGVVINLNCSECATCAK